MFVYNSDESEDDNRKKVFSFKSLKYQPAGIIIDLTNLGADFEVLEGTPIDLNLVTDLNLNDVDTDYIVHSENTLSFPNNAIHGESVITLIIEQL